MSEQSAPVQMHLERIYLKDASFESPNSPQVFTGKWQPEVKVDINTKASALEANRHEVVLKITVEASVEDVGIGFIAEVHQAGIFVIEGANVDQRRQVLGIMCPSTLFPYVRESIDSLVVKGGFPPLNIAPVNFEVVYAEAMKRSAAEQPQVKH
jgi:preprotein translocase subunit SecB